VALEDFVVSPTEADLESEILRRTEQGDMRPRTGRQFDLVLMQLTCGVEYGVPDSCTQRWAILNDVVLLPTYASDRLQQSALAPA
jgi:hypothetical protein